MHNTNHLIALLHCHVTNTHIGKSKAGKTANTGKYTFYYCITFKRFHFCLVYLATVLEYLIAEILKLASNATHDNKKHCIIPCHLQLAIHNNEE